MARSGSPQFIRYAESFKRICALEAELAQELAIRRETMRASIIEPPFSKTDNLANVFAFHRYRAV